MSKISTEDRYRRYFLKNVPLSVPSLLFLQNIGINIVVAFKVPSAQLCFQMGSWQMIAILNRFIALGFGGEVPQY